MKWAIFLAALALTQSAYNHGTEAQGIGKSILVADSYYWSGPEGNLGVEITGKFPSEKKLRRTFNLSSQIGVFKSRKYPFKPTTWKLRDILISVDFNGAGSVATWRVSGPKPLLSKYLMHLRKQYDDRSLFSDFGYRFIDFRPSSD